MPRVTDAYREQRRREILEAAVLCFDRRGLHATTTDDIAAEVGFSAGALYRYFTGKDAIIEAIAADRHSRERELLVDALAAEDPRAAMHGFLREYFAWIAEPDEQRRRRVTVHVWAEALANPRIAAVIERGRAPARDAIRAIEAAVAGGRLPAHVDAEAFVAAVLALIQGFLLQLAWAPTVDSERFLATCSAMVDAYLTTPPAVYD
jgi:AcrR family transcriptional regulator